MEKHTEDHTNQRPLILTLSALIPITVYCALQLLKIPSDQKNAFLFGLSKERLLMLSGFVFLFFLSILALCFRSKIGTFLRDHPSVQSIIPLITGISLFFLLMPAYRFGDGAAYFTRLQPYILWLFLTGLVFSLYLIYTNDGLKPLRESAANLKDQRSSILPVFLILLAGIFFVEITGLGKTVEKSLWNKNGIPLQSIQLFSTLAVFLILRKAGVISFLSGKKRLIHFFAIWAVSAVILSLAAKSPHFFAPGPYLPDGQYYPYSDAVTYDIAAQTALNGWGFNLRRTILKPALVFISFLTHLFTGNNYDRAMMLQSVIFAVLPAVIYLFASEIGGTGCGYLAAAFTLFKEWNALNTGEVLTIHSRLTMSEYLMQIILAALCYAVFRWLQRDQNERLYAIISGGMLMMGIFTRYNFFAFLPAVLLLLLIAYRKQFRQMLKPLLFFFLSMLLTAAPMILRDAVTSSGMISELAFTIDNVLIRQRFQEKSPFEDDENTVPQDLTQAASVSETAADLPETGKDDFNTGQITQEFENNNSDVDLGIFPSMINHGLHNIIASVLTLPMEFSFGNLQSLYTQEGDGLWRDHWQGQFSPRQWVFLGIWTVLGAIAIGCLIRTFGIAGFSVPYFWLVYAFSIGFSRSSGGRYVVPMNWIPMLLLAVCVTILLSKGKLKVTEKSAAPVSSRKLIGVQAAFLLYFTALVLFEIFMPSRNTAAPQGDLAVIREQLGDHENIDWEKVKAQQEEGVLHITHGVVLYPRFYYFRVGEHASSGSTMWKEYSRMSFMGINLDTENMLYRDYMMPHTEAIHEFPQDSVFRAISCTSEFGYEDVLAVTVESPDGEIYTYTRDPLPDFSCPVPEPVCLSLENCY